MLELCKKRNPLIGVARVIGLSVSLFVSQFAMAGCLDDYRIPQKKVVHTIPREVLEELDGYLKHKSPVQGWSKVSEFGDDYAALAARVLSEDDQVINRFYRKLIQNHWTSAIGAERFQKFFYRVARQHFKQYVEILKTGYFPDSDQIVMSYLNAVRAFGLPDITVFDAAWDASGYNAVRTWQSLNHLPDSRTIYPSRACFQIDSREARRIIQDDLLSSLDLGNLLDLK